MAESCVAADVLAMELPRRKDAALYARTAVKAEFAHRLPAQQLDDLLVIVSELATNATLYGVGEIRLRVSVDDGRVHGEIIDEGAGFAGDVREHAVEEVGKKGLLIVATLAERWGIHAGRSHVWFEIAPGDDRDAADSHRDTRRRPPLEASRRFRREHVHGRMS